ncbi:MAG: hypothetical protein H8F28_00895 [Fibrella sp.]|nr:hypothetical protein [Armatimonadota bacterium]
MKRIVLALLCLLLVFGAAMVRPHLSRTSQPLSATPEGVVLIAVDGLGIRESESIRNGASFSAYGLIPTRNGTPDDSDFNAGLRMILSGSRTPEPGAPTLPETARQNKVPLQIHTITGANAVRDAAILFTRLTALGALPGDTSVLMVGVTPGANALQRRERVAPVFYWTQKTATRHPRLLTSPSTRRRPGLVAATDIAATVAALLDLPPVARRVGEGRPIEIVSASSSGAMIADLHRKATAWGQQAREQKLLPVIPWLLAGSFLLSILVRSPPVGRVTQTFVLSIPLALLVVAPFVPTAIYAHAFSDALVYVFAAILVSILATVSGLRESWGNRLPRILAIATAVVIAVDTCTGGFLLSRTPLSYSVLEAARFYGIGNEISGLFLGAVVVAVGTTHGAIATILWGLTTAIILGAPSLGADAGGFVAALVAFTTLTLMPNANGGHSRRINKGGFTLAGTAVIVAIVGFAWWDGSRPASSRTHIGEVVINVREKGFDNLATIAKRKMLVNARLLTTSPWAVLLIVEIAAQLWDIHRRKRQEQVSLVPAGCGTQPALFATMLALFALNDSGVVAGATCGCWLLGVKCQEFGSDER